ncbi:hypothetical protein V501_02393 [Pseudogymnoascus sp. VKM F-4519 (FW-2642)]|nr:hypothetical protein V501_02393 [Pseudogymnoascus sp. VKM F-4519 (FW-2642)]
MHPQTTNKRGINSHCPQCAVHTFATVDVAGAAVLVEVAIVVGAAVVVSTGAGNKANPARRRSKSGLRNPVRHLWLSVLSTVSYYSLMGGEGNLTLTPVRGSAIAGGTGSGEAADAGGGAVAAVLADGGGGADGGVIGAWGC